MPETASWRPSCRPRRQFAAQSRFSTPWPSISGSGPSIRSTFEPAPWHGSMLSASTFSSERRCNWSHGCVLPHTWASSGLERRCRAVPQKRLALQGLGGCFHKRSQSPDPGSRCRMVRRDVKSLVYWEIEIPACGRWLPDRSALGYPVARAGPPRHTRTTRRAAAPLRHRDHTVTKLLGGSVATASVAKRDSGRALQSNVLSRYRRRLAAALLMTSSGLVRAAAGQPSAAASSS